MKYINDPLVKVYKLISNEKEFKFAEEKYPVLKDSDYKQGYFMRYFFRQVNSPFSKILEVDKKQWISFKKDPFYSKVELKWLISGKKDYVYSSNLKSIIHADKSMPGIKKLLENNLLQFYKP